MDAAFEREALRQQMLLRALWRDARPAVVGGWMRDGAAFGRGLEAYRSNAGALAERALAAAFPIVQQLLGEESFAGLARTFWRAAPPGKGDLARWGGALPAFIEGDVQLASEPYLADVARVEWAVHEAEHAADAVAPTGLHTLAGCDPASTRLRLQAGCALVVSAHPVVAIWQAHRSSAEDRFADVRQAFAEGRAESALISRTGWKAGVRAVDGPTARFTAALLRGESLARALAAAGAGFAFEPWLVGALESSLLAAVEETAP